MDRLIKPDVQTIEVFFIRGHKCSHVFRLKNLMHTMSVAVSLTSSNPLEKLTKTISGTCSLNWGLIFLRTPLSLFHSWGRMSRSFFSRLLPGPWKQYFFSQRLSLAAMNPQLTALLRVAAEDGTPQFISALIEAGADVSDTGSEKESLVSLAVKSGKAEAVEILIESGREINNKIDRVLHAAATMNRVVLMAILCLGYADIDLNLVNSQGQTALHLAAIHGQMESLQFLVSIGSEVDVTDHEGWTPLHYAANEGHAEAVEYLINNSVFAKYTVTKKGKTVFALAVDQGYSHLYDSLHLGDLLHRAARIDDVHTMTNCLAKGAKVNGRDQNDWTPLHRAAFKGNLKSVKLLINHGARVDLLDGTGYTPLLRAVELDHIPVAMFLLSHGAKAGFKSLKGMMDFDAENFRYHPSLVNPLHQGEEMA